MNGNAVFRHDRVQCKKNAMKKKVPKIEPCGTPQDKRSCVNPEKLTLSHLCARYDTTDPPPCYKTGQYNLLVYFTKHSR